jgi:putative dehydrogenase
MARMQKSRARSPHARAVGVIGLGIMGGAFAQHLLRSRFEVLGFDPLPTKRAALSAMGGESLRSSAAVAEKAAIIVTSLPAVAAFEAALFGPQGLAAGAKAGTIIIEASTLPIAVKENACARLAEGGIILLDCPVSGTGAQATAGDIAVYASGDERTYIRCKAVLSAFARSHYYCGAFGTGSKLKFIANLLVTIHNLSTAEAFVLAERAGVDLDLVYKVVKDGAGASRMFEVRGLMMAARRYKPATMKVDVYQKDIAIIKDFARELDCPTPLFSLSEIFYDAALASGFGKQDTASVHAILRRLSTQAKAKPHRKGRKGR